MKPPFLSRWLLAVSLLFAGCSTVRHPTEQPPPIAIRAPAPDFTIAAGMLDTWNAIGQILVHEDGVTYEGRSQMLGLYDVNYRGERFLLVTRALVLTDNNRVTTTQIRVALRDGKPDTSDPAIALLGILQTKLPDELQRIAAEAKNKPSEKKSVAKRRRHK